MTATVAQRAAIIRLLDGQPVPQRGNGGQYRVARSLIAKGWAAIDEAGELRLTNAGRDYAIELRAAGAGREGRP